MHKLLFILLLLNSKISFSQTIVFRHLGPNDKTFHALRFRNDTLKQIDEKYIQTMLVEKWVNLSSQDFRFLKKSVRKNTSNVTNIKKEHRIYGAFSIQIQEKKKNTVYYLSTRAISLEYFKNIIKMLNKNNKHHIAKEFDWIVRRIEYN